jgi:hypothetical protein
MEESQRQKNLDVLPKKRDKFQSVDPKHRLVRLDIQKWQLKDKIGLPQYK